MAEMHMCFVLICELVPFFCIVSCPITGSNFTVVPTGAATVEAPNMEVPPAAAPVLPNNDVLVCPKVELPVEAPKSEGFG